MESTGVIRKNTVEWDKARKAARKRDGNRCVVCSSTEDLEVHHIDHGPDNHVLWNLITLCKKCHVLIHQPKSQIEASHLFNYVRILKTSHYHADAFIEVQVRHLGGSEFAHIVADEDEMNNVFQYSWGLYEFVEDYTEKHSKSVEGSESSLLDLGNCPVPYASYEFDKDFRKVTCSYERSTPECNCIGFNGTDCPLHSCKKEWCKEVTLDPWENQVVGDIEKLPYIIIQVRCIPRTPSGYKNQTTLLEYSN